MAKPVEDLDVKEQLAFFFHRNGCIRWQNAERLAEKGPKYKKGDEVRLVARSRKELRTIRRLLRRAQFKRARPFSKGRQWVQPIYGIAAIVRFVELIGQSGQAAAQISKNSATRH